MQALELKIPPVIIALLCAAMSYFFPFGEIAIPFKNTFVIIFLILGAVFGLSGVASFIKAKTTVNPHTIEKANKLVTTDLFRYSRNPMYLGLLFLLIAHGYYSSAISSIIDCIIFIYLIEKLQILPEERILEEKFGQDYRDYKKSVRRWL